MKEKKGCYRRGNKIFLLIATCENKYLRIYK